MPRLIEEEAQAQVPSNDGPDKCLKPYSFHGLNLEALGTHAVGVCPFCEKEKKFSLDLSSGLWRCLVCGLGSEKGGGNLYTFLNQLVKCSLQATTDQEYQAFAKNRGILSIETLRAWGVCRSIISGEWILPGYNPDRKLCQVYQWGTLSSGKRSLLATPGLHHGLFGPAFLGLNMAEEIIYITEGPWDGMAFWELMGQAKDVGEGEARVLGITGTRKASLLENASVLSVPGCSVFREEWLKLFSGRKVILLYDSDHPRSVNGNTFRPGFDGMRRATKLLAKAGEPAKEVHYLCWGEEGYDPNLPDGADLRDQLTQAPDLKGRLPYLNQLLNKVRPIPEDWLPGRGEAAVAAGSTEVECVYCPDWRTLQNSWRLAMNWTEDLDYALSMMLATSLSTLSAGDQLWMKILGSPSCGKSTLCEAMCVNKRHIKGISTLRGFHSGYRDPETGDNTSLITRIMNKCMITKDGDTILQMPDRDRILSEARDLYDKTSRSDYRNGMGAEWEGIMMTWILCGTKTLKLLDQSALGARFLDFEFSHLDDATIDSTMDRIINRSVRTTAIRNRKEAGGGSLGQYEPSMLKAMQLTGGYIDTICNNDDLLAQVEVPPWARREIKILGIYTAAMRARPFVSKEEERHEKELPYRLASQFTRMAQCLAGVFGKTSTDEEVMRRVKRSAIDTSVGKTVDLVTHLVREGEAGTVPESLSTWMQEEQKVVSAYLRFLTKIKVVEVFKPKAKFKGQSPKNRWRITPSIGSIFKEVHNAKYP